MNYRLNPCNKKHFDLEQCLSDNSFVDWKQYHYKYEVGDIVFIYMSAPDSKISYMLEVEEINIPSNIAFDDSMYVLDNSNVKSDISYHPYCGDFVRFRLLKKIDTQSLSLHNLIQHGLKNAPQGPRYIKGELLEYVLNHIL